MRKRFSDILPTWSQCLCVAAVASLAATSPVPSQASQAVAAQAASSTVTGEVLDSNGEPLIGATVMLKGSTDGVATDFDGKFTLKAPVGSTIVISYIGYKTQEVKYDGQPLMVTLAEDTEMLNEVVVVGYGTQKKATMTGAVSVVGADALANKGNLSSPVQALQGQVPGVIITRNSSAPGDESWSMSLRGAVSKTVRHRSSLSMAWSMKASMTCGSSIPPISSR